MIRIYRNLSVVLLVLLAQSCATTSGESQNTAGTPEVPGIADKEFIATPDLAPRERFSKALRMLENGVVGQAQAELKAYIAAVANSRSKNARALLEQTTTPIDEYFPADYFVVSLGDGESLSTLARTYLGDALKFYALARYNSISAPSRVFVGQEVRIPLTESARQARDNPVSEPPVVDIVDVPEQPPATEPPSAEQPVSINDLITAGNFSEAVDYANNAPADSLDNATLIAIYQGYANESMTSNPYVAADAYHHLAELFEQSNDMGAALNALESALSANVEHAQAEDSLAKLKPRLVANYYRSASAAFRRQDLNTTIEYADKVLALQPDHANAQLYRAQALELKDRLEKLNAKNQ